MLFLDWKNLLHGSPATGSYTCSGGWPVLGGEKQKNLFEMWGCSPLQWQGTSCYFNSSSRKKWGRQMLTHCWLRRSMMCPCLFAFPPGFYYILEFIYFYSDWFSIVVKAGLISLCGSFDVSRDKFCLLDMVQRRQCKSKCLRFGSLQINYFS